MTRSCIFSVRTCKLARRGQRGRTSTTLVKAGIQEPKESDFDGMCGEKRQCVLCMLLHADLLSMTKILTKSEIASRAYLPNVRSGIRQVQSICMMLILQYPTFGMPRLTPTKMLRAVGGLP